VVQAGQSPIVNGAKERSACRVGCGSGDDRQCSQSSGHGKVDEGRRGRRPTSPAVLSEHQAGKLLDIADTGIKMKRPALDARPLFPGSPIPALAGGGTNISDPLRDPRAVRRQGSQGRP